MDTLNSYYFIEGFAIAFFSIMAAQQLWKRDMRLRRILGGILLYWLLQHLVSLPFIADFFSDTHYWSRIINAIDMTAAPTCCFLLIELCRPGWLTWSKVALHESPFVTLSAAYILTGQSTYYDLLLGFFALYGLGVVIAITGHYLPRYNQFLREHYSYQEHVNLHWLYVALATFFALMLVYAYCNLQDSILGDCIYLAGSIICWSWVCYCIWRQEMVLGELEATKQENEELKENATTAETDEHLNELLAHSIQKHFIEKQVYLNPKLKLGDMAIAIGTNRTYLSRYLNEQLHTTFYNYVNALRLEHAIRLMHDDTYSITAISAVAGFNSYSTFRRVFQSHFGVSPQEYKSSNISHSQDAIKGMH